MFQRQPSSILLPYTTLFRSRRPSARLRQTGLRQPALRRTRATKLRNARSGQRCKPVAGAHPRLQNRVMSHLRVDRKSTRLNSSHVRISYAVFCLKKKITTTALLFLALSTTNGPSHMHFHCSSSTTVFTHPLFLILPVSTSTLRAQAWLSDRVCVS